jgi:glycosyltransferase involved in cell wall biosynthesis
MKKLVMDGRHLQVAQKGGGIARDANFIKQELSKIFELEIDQYHTKVKKIKRNFRSFIGSKTDLKLNCDIYWCSQPNSLKNSLAASTYVRVHDIFPITNPDWFRGPNVVSFKNAMNFAIQEKHIFVANSNYTKMQIEKNLGIKKNLINILPCKVELLSGSFCENCDACRYLEIIPDNFILNVGTIEPRKNLDLLNVVFNDNNFPKLVVVGRNGWKSSKIVRGLSQNSRLTWLKTACDAALDQLYRRTNLFISASLDEGFDLPSHEAILYNLPVLLSDIPIRREMPISFPMPKPELASDWVKLLNHSLEKPDEFTVKGTQFVSNFETNLREIINHE